MRSRHPYQSARPSQLTNTEVNLAMTLSYEEVVPERESVEEPDEALDQRLQNADTLVPFPITHDAQHANTDPYATDLYEQLGQLLAMEWSQLNELTLASLKANWEESRQWLTERPEQLLPMLLRSYENAVHQNRALRDLQRELQGLRKRLQLQTKEEKNSLDAQLDAAKASLGERQQWLADHPDPILILDNQQQVQYANPAALRLLGQDIEVLRAEPLALPLSCNPTELPYTTPEGQEKILELQSVETCWQGDRGKMVVVRDITAHKKLQHQWQQVALHDPLTGLPNRLLFLDRLGQAMRRTAREPNRSFAVLFLDLDGFKDINDTLGHPCGDSLLKTLANRISRCIRSCDTVARLGGDEFTLLLDGIQDSKAAAAVASRILSAVGEKVSLQGEEIQLTASIGLVMNHPRYTTPESLLEDADLAMYTAKARGKARAEIFQSITQKQLNPSK